MGGADKEQTLIEHLAELRGRLLRSLLCILLVLVALLPFSSGIYRLVATPMLAKLPAGSGMIATEVAAPFLVPFQLCIYAALFIAMPYVLYQIWAFVAPGLYRNERRFALPLLLSSILLFYTGTAFAFFVVFPMVFGFFTAVRPPDVAIMTDIGHYLDFIMKMLLAFGIAFEVPIATILLVWTGITSAATLSGLRPYIVVGAFTLGAILTPPDVMSQLLLSIPLWLLFESGLYFSRFFAPSGARDTGEESAP